jgi:hypothetical protein
VGHALMWWRVGWPRSVAPYVAILLYGSRACGPKVAESDRIQTGQRPSERSWNAISNVVIY